MRKPRLWAIAAVTAVVLVGLIAAAASARTTAPATKSASIKACALLPDTTSSTRYTLFDAPYLKAAFSKAGVAATVLNAHNDPQKQKSQAQQCLAQGAKVILLDQLDPASGASITNLAVSGGAKVIDYDRLVVGSKASYYVSFDNSTVGKLQGKGLVGALQAKKLYGKHPVIAELNGGHQGQQRQAVQAGVRLGPQPPLQERHLQEGEGRRSVDAVGRDDRTPDLRPDARP